MLPREDRPIFREHGAGPGKEGAHGRWSSRRHGQARRDAPLPPPARRWLRAGMPAPWSLRGSGARWRSYMTRTRMGSRTLLQQAMQQARRALQRAAAERK